jgi:tuberculosinol/isotuberculosinol synthase
MQKPTSLEEFQRLPTEEVAQLVREAGPRVCVFPVNGTRRWFMLEHGSEAEKGNPEAFLNQMVETHIALYKLCFDHGIDTLVTPIFGLDILERGDADVSARGMALLGSPQFMEFYRTYGVRVRFYGDYCKVLNATPYAYLSDSFDNITVQTLEHQQYRLFFGVCAHDATETIAEISVRFYQEHKRLPNKHEIVEAYYGEYVEPADFFIGFSPFAVFDMPLLATGAEDLYFTVSPSFYMDTHSLRAILYDHLYTRPGEPDYGEMTADDWNAAHQFYQMNRRNVLGTGVRPARGGIWYPTGEVHLPDTFERLP